MAVSIVHPSSPTWRRRAPLADDGRGTASPDLAGARVAHHHGRPRRPDSNFEGKGKSPIRISGRAPRATLALLLLSSAARAESGGVAGDVSSPGPAPAATTDGSPTPDFFDVNKFRADPSNPGAIRIPGTNVAIYIGGFAQLDVIYDVQRDWELRRFVVSLDSRRRRHGQHRVRLTARQSRVFIETDAPLVGPPLCSRTSRSTSSIRKTRGISICAMLSEGHRTAATACASSAVRPGRRSWTRPCCPSQLDYAGPPRCRQCPAA